MHKYRRLLQDARPDWRFFCLILALTIAASMLAALQPWPLAWLTDRDLRNLAYFLSYQKSKY